MTAPADSPAAPRSRAPAAARPGPAGRARARDARAPRGAHRRRPPDDGPVPLDDHDLAQDPGRGLRESRLSFPLGPPLRELPEHVERLPDDVRDVLPQLVQARRPLNTIGQLVSCSMAAFAFAVLPFRGPRAAVRAAPGDPDHPVPGRPRPELHPLPDCCRTRSARAGTGSGRRSRCGSGPSWAAPSGPSCSASSSWRSRRSSPTRPGSTARTRGRSIATSTCRWPSRRWRRWRSSRSCGPGTTCSTRSSTCATSTSTRRRSGWRFFQGQYVGQVAGDDGGRPRQPARR